MAKYDYPYKKGVNITAWVLQDLVCIILLAASAWVLSLVDSHEVTGNLTGLLSGAAGLQIAITLLNIIINVVEIVLIARKQMPPVLYLTFASIKTGIWGIIFILDLVTLSVISIILSLILLATSLLQLIYGAILIHRKRKGTLRGGSYAAATRAPGLLEAGACGAPQPGSYYAPRGVGVGSTEYKPAADVCAAPSPAPTPSPASQNPYAHGGSYELDSRSPHS
ncbi:hypothetical protein GGR52DRAFT_569770 [Hypoxylon sp. FL1284]|nr:hypothetical protein GGR52DRAFT_569770 [Hypoxylon sp. FL1284]